jgi:hypothetical protein
MRARVNPSEEHLHLALNLPWAGPGPAPGRFGRPCVFLACHPQPPAAPGNPRAHPAAVQQVGHRLRRGQLGGRPPGFDSDAYKQRNSVERCINRLRQWRGLASRTDTLAIAYQAALHLASILIWIRR